MIHDNIFLILALLFAISMFSMLSVKLKVSYPILLVLAGLIIGFIPGIPPVILDPDLVFLIFLPPLLYAAAWNTSWKDFWKYRRPIGLLSIGLVIFTSTAIAFISSAIIPGFPLAYGFLLGGIISPPDAVAATSVLQGLKIPKRVVAILEGESLINDASSLIVFRFALAAILTGQFSIVEASGEFFMVAGMGVLIGLGVACLIYLAHRFLPTNPSIDTAITLLSPYLMYLAAEQFNYSGVMAVVTGGLFLSNRSHAIFSYDTRMQAYSFWDTFTFLLNGLVFILIGLQLPQIISGLGEYSIWDGIFYGIIISLLTILIRIIWVFPGAYIPRLLSKKVRNGEARPAPATVFLVAWSGMRGVVSLAAALAVPLTLASGAAFPFRNLLLFITFIVILVTLVFQGLSLSWVIRKLNIVDEPEANHEELELALKLQLAEASLDLINSRYAAEAETMEVYKRIKERYERMAQISFKKIVEGESVDNSFMPKYRQMLLDIIAVKRVHLQRLKREQLYSDEMIRVKERELDLEEARLRTS